VDAINKKWVFNWEKIKYKKKKNKDLWQRFLQSYKNHNITMKWVKGHAGHIQNERCDYLAVQASNSRTLKVDKEYELTNSENNSLFD